MSDSARDLVPEYVLGVLPEGARKDVEAAIQDSADLDEEVRLSRLAIASLTDGLPPARVAPTDRSRLMATLASPDRFRGFFPVLRRWFDLGEQELRAALALVDAGTAWIDAPFPGVRYFHFQGGAAAVGKESGCLVLSPGARFPRHLHAGAERSMVLEGTLVLDGRQWHAGDVVETAGGTTHDFAAGPGRDLVLIVIHDGISFPA